MKTIILLLTIVSSIAFAKTFQAVGEDKIKVSMSANWASYNPEKNEYYQILDFMGKGVSLPYGVSITGAGGKSFTFLDNQVSGLSFAYGFTDKMHLALSLPIFNMMIKDENSGTTIFGATQFGFIFSKAMNFFDLTTNIHISIPFFEMYSGYYNTGDSNFDQTLALGFTLAIDSFQSSDLIWGIWIGVLKSFKKSKILIDGDMELEMRYKDAVLVNIVGILGYRINSDLSTKLNIYYDVPNLDKDRASAPNFYDGELSFRTSIDMKLTLNMVFSIGLWYRMGISDNSAFKDVTNLGVSLGYSATF